ncbi:glycosyltransferase family 2 protein [Sphingobium phenoxybenzoativorans]|uniref:glycosyltransferase family 2 protein n=1 Tax=Sphingobium phenoxybenzoativorans TaxID=1592790 RepID=UPI001495BAAC|nr:glycosyltransferase [Sphingobium phenoxybenzoativorans]
MTASAENSSGSFPVTRANLVQPRRYSVDFQTDHASKNADVSLVVCTRNRAERLKPMLDSLRSAILNSSAIVQVILIDSFSDDLTKEVLIEWARDQPFWVSVVRAQEAGASLARNIGITEAMGGIVAFTDDDCVISEDYITAISRAVSNLAEPQIIGGRIMLGDPDDLPITIKEDELGSCFEGKRIPSGYIMSANFVITYATFGRIGGFDENFGPGAAFKAAEDSELLMRALLENVPIRYDPDIVVYHFHGRKTFDQARKLYSGYSFGDGALFAKYFFKHPMILRRVAVLCRDAIREIVIPGDDAILGRRKTQWRLRRLFRGGVAYLKHSGKSLRA